MVSASDISDMSMYEYAEFVKQTFGGKAEYRPASATVDMTKYNDVYYSLWKPKNGYDTWRDDWIRHGDLESLERMLDYVRCD